MHSGNEWRLLVSFLLFPLYPEEKVLLTTGYDVGLNPKARLGIAEKIKSFPIRESNPGYPVRRHSLYRLKRHL